MSPPGARRIRPALLVWLGRTRARLRATWAALRAEGSTPGRLAAAVFLGVLVGTSPFYGLQTLLVLLLAGLLRVNRLAALAAAQVSLPPLYPLLVVGSLQTGDLLLPGRAREVSLATLPATTAGWWRLLSELSGEWLVGSLVLGAGLGLCGGAVVYALVRRRGLQAPDLAIDGRGPAGGD